MNCTTIDLLGGGWVKATVVWQSNGDINHHLFQMNHGVHFSRTDYSKGKTESNWTLHSGQSGSLLFPLSGWSDQDVENLAIGMAKNGGME